MHRSLVTALEVIAALFGLAGGFTVWEAVTMQGGSAPQQAALAAMGIGVAAIPYFMGPIYVTDPSDRLDHRLTVPGPHRAHKLPQ